MRFAVLNAIGAVLWATLVTGAGYAFGLAIESFSVDLNRIEEFILLGIVAAGLAVYMFGPDMERVWGRRGDLTRLSGLAGGFLLMRYRKKWR